MLFALLFANIFIMTEDVCLKFSNCKSVGRKKRKHFKEKRLASVKNPGSQELTLSKAQKEQVGGCLFTRFLEWTDDPMLASFTSEASHYRGRRRVGRLWLKRLNVGELIWISNHKLQTDCWFGLKFWSMVSDPIWPKQWIEPSYHHRISRVGLFYLNA